MSRNIFIILLLIFGILSLPAEIVIDITLPSLLSEYSDFGTLDNDEFESSVSDIEDDINEAMNKPLISKAVSNSTALTSQIPSTSLIFRSNNYSFSLGSSASIYSHTFDSDQLVNEISDFEENDDIKLGGSVHVINANFTFPINKYLPDTIVFISLANTRWEKDEYYFNNYFIQTGLGKPIVPAVKSRGFFYWTPLYGQCNISYSYSKAGVKIDLDTINIDMELDPDGSGIIPSESFSISIEPEVDVNIESKIFTSAFSLSTGISFFESSHFYLGSGFLLSLGKTYASIDAYEELNIDESVQEYIEDSGSVTVSGKAAEGSPLLIQPFVYSGFQLQFSSVYINIPLLYGVKRGLGLGLYLGVSF